jgi:adenine-specific DNA methylase
MAHGLSARSDQEVLEIKDANALASSIVLVCRKRPADAPVITRADLMCAQA